MNPIQLTIVKHLFNMSNSECAKYLGGDVSKESWRKWEKGINKIPEDVETAVNNLLNTRKAQLKDWSKEHANLQISVIYYDHVEDCESFLDWKFTNAQAITLASDYGARIVKFDREAYQCWLGEAIDNKTARDQWASQQL